LDIELLRLVRREERATVRLAAHVLSTFKSVRLFWAYNHPTAPLLREILNRLTIATWPEARLRQHAMHRIGDVVFSDWEPLADFHTPVHPSVARALGLTWWTPDLKYRFHGAEELTQTEYQKLYLEERIRRQLAQAEVEN
jgi:hypothetical protein